MATMEELLTRDSAEQQRAVGSFVHKHVHGRLSMLVDALAKGYGMQGGALQDYMETCFELCTPTVDDDDRENALKAASIAWQPRADTDGKIDGYYWIEQSDLDQHKTDLAEYQEALNRADNAELEAPEEPTWNGPFDDLEELCDNVQGMFSLFEVEATGEIFEHWVVDEYLYRELRDQGCTVGELDGLYVWGRTTTGQAISMDGVIIGIWLSSPEWQGGPSVKPSYDELVEAMTAILKVERTQGVTDEEAETAIERIDELLSLIDA